MDALIVTLVLASFGVVYLIKTVYTSRKGKKPERKHFDHYW
ncbi:hypothetical protein [Pontibacter cellulosilyticus]|nr:hypothetical protein [Pontibacter cellulosilyticus]